MNVGCKDCKDRYVGCHSTCVIYKDYVQDLYALKQKIKDQKSKYKEVNEYNASAIRKYKRRSGKK